MAARHKNRFWHETNPEKSSRADIWCSRPQIALRVFVVSIGTQGLRRFGNRVKFSVLAHQERIVQGQAWILCRSSGHIDTSE